MKPTILTSLCCSFVVAVAMFLCMERVPAGAAQPEKPAPRKSVEYQVVQIRMSPGVAGEERVFNRQLASLSKDGWKYVDTLYAHPTGRIGVSYLLFERTKR